MLEANRAVFPTGPPLTPNAVKALLKYTAIPLTNPDTGAPYDKLTQGTGSLNTAGAVQVAGAIDPSVGVGNWWLKIPVGETTTLAHFKVYRRFRNRMIPAVYPPDVE